MLENYMKNSDKLQKMQKMLGKFIYKNLLYKNCRKCQKKLEKFMKISNKLQKMQKIFRKYQKILFIKFYCTKIVENARKDYENFR